MSPTRSILLAAGAVAIVWAAAPAAVAQTGDAQWVEAPTVADIAAAYPAKAKAARQGGRVMLSCVIGRDQHPKNCGPVLEQPVLFGFGAAARKLAYQMKISTPEIVGQNVFVPVTFDPAVLSAQAMVSKPAWVAAPTLEDFQASFPKSQNGVNDVRVVLGCTVEAGGSLGGCAVATETPAGQGYGQGALALAPKFKMSPWSLEGEPTVGAKIELPIHYILTPVTAATTTAASSPPLPGATVSPLTVNPEVAISKRRNTDPNETLCHDELPPGTRFAVKVCAKRWMFDERTQLQQQLLRDWQKTPIT
jgi:hypothetical protein